MRKKTQLIHGGIARDKHTGAVSVPIYHSSTFKQEGVGNFVYEYARTGNPTREAVEALIRDIENGYRGFAFGSGMAAITSVMMLLSAGDHIIITDDVYGGTFRVMSKVLTRFNLEFTFVDTSSVEEIKKAIQPNTKAIYVETPTNPLLKITDIEAVSTMAKAHELLFIVDNTFSTPYWQNPIELGANIVLHSATKYLGGHSDVVAGLVVVDSEELGTQLHFIQNSVGGILGPQDSWLLIRGIRTLGIRMEEIEENTKHIVDFLLQHDAVSKVYYPGLIDHKGHDIHKKQARGFGGMISFDVGSTEKAEDLLRRTKYFTLAESLGAVESLISLPAKMTHASIPAERRAELGITDGLVRISVGLEDVEDLIEDLAQALK
ncbi:bifunctional cystathionine gamma-lyase/homocysteine desulfhydrase [Schinkia azotoformans]|uniref:bifunctional cystathionine gamma-lyase/homocysteine desulfhydrase n=1 Tax=Schinkia azotoformans TaxID=1454 RepID=UPI002DB645CF|nr:bifunctional cystathionine gamma-lyase/homocysteine desulfhydrase [Schinkia azotoformans]MEC1716423.1 bifunctional cystathionine gamma-lyase/homocysteine desulfhydrase [Schinkia azotoformans]MEC1746933.1 bifunctional cystathionine gamma-lyase/homocysteine desulfhydrase [Schinkia azotoformans]MEC1758695.1 bifunctional cystathionine gamma-lyase/homocysteine desulfhydrase [Schinkia azotoformans]MED4377910.1 bifunctional cystathionine gamma-lyase/homocysteine desulfhydrase [Schinkia azotoformans